MRKANIRTIGLPEEEEREKGARSVFSKIIAENFPNMGKELNIQIQEANRIPYFLIAKRPSPKYLVMKLSKTDDQERIFKATRGKRKKQPAKEALLGYQRTSQQTLYRTGTRNDRFKVVKEKLPANNTFSSNVSLQL